MAFYECTTKTIEAPTVHLLWCYSDENVCTDESLVDVTAVRCHVLAAEVVNTLNPS